MATEIISPVGTIVYSSLNRKTTRKRGDTENTVYTFRLEFDGDSPEAQAFRAKIEEVNSAIPSEDKVSKPGNFKVKASTAYKVPVYDTDGSELKFEDIPSIASGTAVMVVQPYMGSGEGGCINLTAVKLLEYKEYEAEGESAEERKARIAAAINRITR